MEIIKNDHNNNKDVKISKSLSVGAHSLNLIVQYELIQLLKYWWVTSLKTLPWILCDVCVRSDVCELLKPVLELNLSTDGVSTLCADSKVKCFGPLQLRSRWFPRYFITGLFFTSCPEKGYPATSEHWAPSHWISCDCMNFMSCSDRFNLFSF